MAPKKLKIAFAAFRVFGCIFSAALLFAGCSFRPEFSSPELLEAEKSFARTETQIDSTAAAARYQLACRNLMLKALDYRLSKLSSKDRIRLLEEQFDWYDSVRLKERDYTFETHGSGASMQFYLDQAGLFKQRFDELIENTGHNTTCLKLL